jgi:1-acyl-sn-glycerol-3-phosphate acyltransferase
MQPILIEKPYRFIPPHRGRWWPVIIQRLHLYDIYLRRVHGVVDYECRQTELLRQSLRAGHGILLTPNHCRVCDPIVMGFLAPGRRYAMASWHLFTRVVSPRAIRRMGGFSVYREGVDRQAIDTPRGFCSRPAPLIIFPEGSVTKPRPPHSC